MSRYVIQPFAQYTLDQRQVTEIALGFDYVTGYFIQVFAEDKEDPMLDFPILDEDSMFDGLGYGGLLERLSLFGVTFKEARSPRLRLFIHCIQGDPRLTLNQVLDKIALDLPF